MRRIYIALLALSLTGCGTLIPKRVELFQKKVKAVPEATASQTDTARQVALRAKERASETYIAAISTGASTNVVIPAKETALLTDAVSEFVGPPIRPSSDPSAELAAELRGELAKLNKRIDTFRERQEDFVGKKIEGTGLFQVSYFAWAGGAVLLAVLLYAVLRLVLTAASAANPGAAIGLGVVNAGAAVVGRGFAQIVHGGEAFKTWVGKEISDPALQQKVLDAFRSSHMAEADGDVQALVKQLTK